MYSTEWFLENQRGELLLLLKDFGSEMLVQIITFVRSKNESGRLKHQA